MHSIAGRDRKVHFLGAGGCRALVLVGCLSAAACGGSVPPGFDESSAPADARESLAAALRQCTIDYGYNPDTAGGLGPTQLGVGEVDWRDCAHDAMERIVEPNLRNPDALEALIDADEELTDGIEEGTATRAQRTAALQAQLNNIRAQEQQLYQQSASNLGAAQILDAATSDLEYQRFHSDIESIARLL